MRIGIDFDGTFADVVQGKIALARELFAIELPPDRTWPAEAAAVIGEERYALLEGVLYGTSRTSQIPPVDGSVDVSRRLAEQHELIVLTARTDDERGPAEAWIQRHEVPITRLINTNRAPKPPVCAELEIDILLDDWEHSFVDMREETASVLLDQPHNQRPVEPHITRVANWQAFEVLVGELEGRFQSRSVERGP